MRSYAIIIFILMVIIAILMPRSDSAKELAEMQDKVYELERGFAVMETELQFYKLVLLRKKPCYIVTATAYTPCEEECDSDPFVTALNTRTTPGWTVAVSRDLSHLLGHTIYVEGVGGRGGVRSVEDVMAARHKKRIDLCVSARKDAVNFGVRRDIKITVLD